MYVPFGYVGGEGDLVGAGFVQGQKVNGDGAGGELHVFACAGQIVSAFPIDPDRRIGWRDLSDRTGKAGQDRIDLRHGRSNIARRDRIAL